MLYMYVYMYFCCYYFLLLFSFIEVPSNKILSCWKINKIYLNHNINKYRKANKTSEEQHAMKNNAYVHDMTINVVVMTYIFPHANMFYS